MKFLLKIKHQIYPIKLECPKYVMYQKYQICKLSSNKLPANYQAINLAWYEPVNFIIAKVDHTV